MWYKSAYFIHFFHLWLLRVLVISLRPAILVVILTSAK